MYLTTGFPTYLYTIDIGDVRIVCPIAERTFAGYSDIVTPYGFSGFVGTGPCPAFPGAWNDFVKQKGYVCGYIGLSPIFQDVSYLPASDAYRHNDIYLLDLSLPQSQLYANMSPTRRYDLRHWQDDISRLTLVKSAGREFFLSNYHSFMQSRNASRAYEFSEATLSFLLDLPSVFIVAVRIAGSVEAVSVFSYTQDVGDYLFNVSLPEGRQFSALLIWHGANHLKSLGVPLLNLGGGVRADDGVSAFKRRFGGRRIPMQALKQIYRPQVYEELCRQANAAPHDNTGYFPAYRRA
jgi:hypothetical protein